MNTKKSTYDSTLTYIFNYVNNATYNSSNGININSMLPVDSSYSLYETSVSTTNGNTYYEILFFNTSTLYALPTAIAQLDKKLTAKLSLGTYKYTGMAIQSSKNITSSTEDDIYIDCQPVNKSTGEIYVPVDKPSLDYSNMFSDMGDNISGPLSSALIGLLLIVGIYSGSKILFDRLSSNKA